MIEVPLEQAGAALEAMGGLPMPEESRWVAVARLSLPTENKATAVGLVAGGGATETPRVNQDLRVDERDPASTPVVVPSSGGEGERKNSPRAEKTPAQKAAIRAVLLCKEPVFRMWLGRFALENDTEAGAAERVRELIGAGSRRDIAIDPDVYGRWAKLVGEYDDFVRYGDRR